MLQDKGCRISGSDVVNVSQHYRGARVVMRGQSLIATAKAKIAQFHQAVVSVGFLFDAMTRQRDDDSIAAGDTVFLPKRGRGGRFGLVVDVSVTHVTVLLAGNKYATNHKYADVESLESYSVRRVIGIVCFSLVNRA